MADYPLVSFVLISYKQEQFIREALAGAFAQTYSPLEIILSDDCSPDRTFEIMQELVAAYQGPHKIILHRNEKNLGLCGNVNQAVALSHGELIVGAAGDDVSLPNRCARMAEEWLKPGRRWHSICSNAEIMDEAGRSRGPWQSLLSPRSLNSIETALDSGLVGSYGCCHAFSRANFEVFGPLHPRAPGEDEIIGFRSLILGGIHWIPEMLVRYRRHSGNLYKDAEDLKNMSREERKRAIKEDEYACSLRRQLYREYFQTAAKKGRLSQAEAARYTQILDHRYPFYQFDIICKNSLLFAATWLVGKTLSGKYRRGMLTKLKCEYIPFGIRTTLRRWRAASRAGNPAAGSQPEGRV